VVRALRFGAGFRAPLDFRGVLAALVFRDAFRAPGFFRAGDLREAFLRAGMEPSLFETYRR